MADGQRYAEEFRARGHDFHCYSYLDGAQRKDELIQAHKAGEIMGLVSIEALTRGYDVADIQCVVDAHPWRKAVSQVIQQAGRGMRPAEGKEFCLLLDHAQNYLRFRSRLESFFENGMDELVAMDKMPGEDAPDRKLVICPECSAIRQGPKCLECGYVWPERKTPVAGEQGTICVDGELLPLDDLDPRGHVAKVGRSEYELPSPNLGWRMLCSMAQERNKNDITGQKWCQAQHRNLYGGFAHRNFNHEGDHDPGARCVTAVGSGARAEALQGQDGEEGMMSVQILIGDALDPSSASCPMPRCIVVSRRRRTGGCGRTPVIPWHDRAGADVCRAHGQPGGRVP